MSILTIHALPSVMADALAHLAASDARAHGWSDRPKETIFFLPR